VPRFNIVVQLRGSFATVTVSRAAALGDDTNIQNRIRCEHEGVPARRGAWLPADRKVRTDCLQPKAEFDPRMPGENRTGIAGCTEADAHEDRQEWSILHSPPNRFFEIAR
jgi:hypothetical protein